ncbi:aldehyde dehydrogenase family protein [Streptomyces badius]
MGARRRAATVTTGEPFDPAYRDASPEQVAEAAGCPVVVKAHPAHPGTGEAMARAALAAAALTGVPAGVFALLVGRGHEASLAPVRDPGVAAAGFTGPGSAGPAPLVAAAVPRHRARAAAQWRNGCRRRPRRGGRRSAARCRSPSGPITITATG